jgi:subtilisin family serine protease
MKTKNFRLLLLILFVSIVAMTNAAPQKRVNKELQHIYRISLVDKHGSKYSLKHPERFLSPRALERRARQGLQVDSTDLPLSASYLKAIRKTGANVVGQSKWLNTVLVSNCNAVCLEQLNKLKCIKKVEQVWMAPDTLYAPPIRDRLSSKENVASESYYGKGETQIDLLNGKPLHEAGYKGKGMMIAIVDGGYMNADSISLLNNVRILGWKNFAATHPESIFKEVDHGTMVLSCIGMNRPGVFVGTAPEAEFWLLRSEVDNYEQVVEEDYWVHAVEFADSVGADIISSSLGYQNFETKVGDHRYSDQNGLTATNSRAASMVAQKGMVLVNSAGNFGRGSWKKINCPADAHNILAVGAVYSNRINTEFSSIGPSADNRVKPDVMSMGGGSTVVDGTGEVTTANGTSFSTPILSGMVACLWQAHRNMTALEIMNLIRSCGDSYDEPNNIFGYGIPDFGRAHKLAK